MFYPNDYNKIPMNEIILKAIHLHRYLHLVETLFLNRLANYFKISQSLKFFYFLLLIRDRLVCHFHRFRNN